MGLLAHVLQPAPSSPTTTPGSDIRAQAVQTWVYGVIWLFVAVMVGVVLLMVARRWALASRAVSSRHSKRRKTDTSSAWEESGRRMDVPRVAEDEQGEEP
ncbi:MAG: hypothetical protein QM783_09040 [Phycisphaerales bacterium]